MPQENKYARKSLRTRSETIAVELGKAAYLEIYANLQQGKTYFSITTKEGVQQLRTMQLELLSNPSRLKRRYLINKAVNQRLEKTN